MMLYYALIFLLVGLVAGILGQTGIAAVAGQISWILFVIGIVLLIIHLVRGAYRRAYDESPHAPIARVAFTVEVRRRMGDPSAGAHTGVRAERGRVPIHSPDNDRADRGAPQAVMAGRRMTGSTFGRRSMIQALRRP